MFKTIEDIDKKLVSESIVNFKRNADLVKFNLTEDGLVDKYLNERLESTFAFSKLSLLRECKNLIQEGYELEEAEIGANKENVSDELDNEEQTIKDNIEKADEVQELKNELEDKLDNIFEDSKEIITKEFKIGRNNVEVELEKLDDNYKVRKIWWYYNNNQASTSFLYDAEDDKFTSFENGNYLTQGQENLLKQRIKKLIGNEVKEESLATDKFPSTPFSKKRLSINQLLSINPYDMLSINQIAWISEHYCEIEDFFNAIKDLAEQVNVDFDEPFLSIEDYLNELGG